MLPQAREPRPPAEVVSDPDILGGWPVVKGTRVPAETILICLKEGMERSEIVLHYPPLPPDGIDAIIRWNEGQKRAAE